MFCTLPKQEARATWPGLLVSLLCAAPGDCFSGVATQNPENTPLDLNLRGMQVNGLHL